MRKAVDSIVALTVLIAVGSAASGCGSAAEHDTSSAKPVAATKVHGAATKERRHAANEPVATVAGRTITRGALERWVSATTSGQEGVPRPPAYTACIERSASVTATPTRQVTERLKRACQGQYEELLKSSLSSLIHAQWLIREGADEGLAVGRVVASNVSIERLSQRISRKLERNLPTATRADAASYYLHHKLNFVLPEKRDLYILQAPSYAAATKAKREIEAGVSFAAAVKKTPSRQPAVSHDGLVRGLTSYNLGEPALNKALFGAHLKTLSGPVWIPGFGYFVFEIIHRVAARQRTLAEVEPMIVEQQSQLLRAPTLKRRIASLRRKWTSRTNCRPGYVVKYCRQYKAGSQEESTSL